MVEHVKDFYQARLIAAENAAKHGWLIGYNPNNDRHNCNACAHVADFYFLRALQAIDARYMGSL